MKNHRFIIVLILTLVYFQAQAADLQRALRASYTAEAKRDYSEALKSLTEATITDSKNYFLQMRVGYLNMMLGQYNASIDAYESAARLEPMAVEPALGALKSAVALGDWAMAETWGNAVLKLDPSNYMGLSRLAYSYLCRKDYAKAAQYYEKVSDLYPSDTDMKGGFAWSRYYMGDKAKARTLFGEILEVKPDDASAKQGIALIK